MKKLLFFCCITSFLCGCCYTLQVPIVQRTGEIKTYAYAYVTPTSAISASAGGSRDNISPTHTVNPAEHIAGYLMKQGYILIPYIDESIAGRTLIVNYGYLGKHSVFTFWQANNICIQLYDAKTHQLVASSEAEGYAGDDAQDIQQAIQRALDALFVE